MAVLLAVVATGCATTSVAPSIIRFEPVVPDKTEFRVGVRTGPRLVAGLEGVRTGTWRGTDDSFSASNWGLAWDLSLQIPTKSGLAFHLGLQAEFAYPLPFPGIGAWGGASYLIKLGRFTISPGVAARGGTDFGFIIGQGSGGFAAGSVLSSDLSVSFGVRADDDTRFGIVPFISYQQPFGTRVAPYPGVMYTGVLAVVRFSRVEGSIGFGHVFSPDGLGFNVPLIGIRVGDF